MEQDRRWNWPKLFYQMWQNCPDWQTPFSSSPHFLECIPKTWTFARIWRCTQYILSVRHCQDITELLKQRCLWATDTNQKWVSFPSLLGTCQKLARGGEGGGNRGRVTTFWDWRKGRGHEKWAVKRGRVMQICVRDHVEVHSQKTKEVLYLVKNTWKK